MFGQIAGWGGDTTNTPPHPPSAVMERKILLRSPAWDFPVLLSGRGKLWSGLCGSVQSPGREEMLTLCPVLGSLAVLPIFSVMLLRKGCTPAPSLAWPMPLLSVLPCYSSPNKGHGLALPSCHPDTRAQGLHGPHQYLTAILSLCCIKITRGEVIPPLTAGVWKYTKVKAQAWNEWIWYPATRSPMQPLAVQRGVPVIAHVVCLNRRFHPCLVVLYVKQQICYRSRFVKEHYIEYGPINFTI